MWMNFDREVVIGGKLMGDVVERKYMSDVVDDYGWLM